MNEITKETLQILRDHADFCLRHPEEFKDGNPKYIKIIAEKLIKVNKPKDEANDEHQTTSQKL